MHNKASMVAVGVLLASRAMAQQPIPVAQPQPGQQAPGPVVAMQPPGYPGLQGQPQQFQPAPQQFVPTAPGPRAGFFCMGDLSLAGHAVGRSDTTISGGGLGLRLAAGGMLNPNVGLFGGFSYFESDGVTVEQGNMSVDSDAISMSTESFFGGMRLVSDGDWYLEGTVGTLKLGLKDKLAGETLKSDVGWIATVGAGKEWRFLTGFNVGVGARLGVGTLPAKDGGGDPVAAQLDLLFSLGYANSR
jgi:hypothetical protein